jgi:hypothetical protein
MAKWSSTRSIGIPYANIRNTEVTLLDGAMTKISSGIPPLLKSVKLYHTLANVFEHFDSHSKMAPKILFGENGIIHEVVPHQLVICFNLLFTFKAKMMATSSSSERSHSSSSLNHKKNTSTSKDICF